jgi:acyl carrier protein
METGLINSMGILQVVDFIERSYGIKLKEDEFVPENLDSIERIVCFLNHSREPQEFSICA